MLIALQFIVCAVAIGLAGFELSRSAHVISLRTGLSGSWIGLALLASVTSLPELIIGITSVTVAQAPDVALGNALGSCVLNLLFLGLIDVLSKPQTVWSRASSEHLLTAAFSVLLLGLALSGLLLSQVARTNGREVSVFVAQWGFDMASPALLGLYFLAIRTLWVHEQVQSPQVHGSAARGAVPDTADAALLSLRSALLRFALAAVVVLAVGVWLPFVAVELATVLGWNRSLIGALFVAFVTTLPELVVTLSALRLGAIDLAIGNLLGSTLFNVSIIAVGDFFYRQGSLLADVSPVHAVTAGMALTMNGLVMIGLVLRPQTRLFGIAAWISLGLAVLYLLNTYVLFEYGD
jgi:cation:H+ antiporter